MADLITGLPEVDATRQELVAAMVQRELKAQAIVASSVMDVSQFAEPGSKTIKFPKATSFNVEKKLSGSAASAQALTYTTDDLPLDQHAVIQWIIEKRASLQSRVNLEMEAINEENEICPECCATHNYLDSNECMLEAFQNVTGRHPELNINEHIDLINLAWALSKANKFN